MSPVTNVGSRWASGDLIFYEKNVSLGAIGNILEIADDEVVVGSTTNDINFSWKGTTTGTFDLDAGAHTLALTGLATSTDGAVTITNTLDVNVAVLADGDYAFSSKGYVASGSSDGAAAYFEGHATGTSDGAIYGVGAWLNVDSGTHAYGLYGLDVGLYAADATYTGAYVCAASFYTHVCNDTAAPTNHYMLRFNTNASEDTPDAWFHAANPECVAYSSNATATGSKLGAIHIYVTGGCSDGYIWVYDSTGA